MTADFILLLFIAPFFMQPWTPTDAARAFAEDVAAALDAVFPHNRMAAADALGLKLADLSQQLSCQKPLNLYRLTSPDIPDRFWDELFERRAARRGGLYLRAEIVTVLKGAASLRTNARDLFITEGQGA